ncbi:MAG: ECF transporter S component [Lachnospiraceae bacterium]
MKAEVRTQPEILYMTQFALLAGMEILLCTTALGSVALGPLSFTLGHIPVILCAITMGKRAGVGMGLLFGFLRFLMATLSPGLVSFVFTPFYSVGEIHGNGWSLLISLLPRAMIGLVTAVTYEFLSRRLAGTGREFLVFGAAGVAGSLTNTVLVLGGIGVFFGEAYATVLGKAFFVLMAGTILTNAIPEAVLAGMIAYAAGKPLVRYVIK